MASRSPQPSGNTRLGSYCLALSRDVPNAWQTLRQGVALLFAVVALVGLGHGAAIAQSAISELQAAYPAVPRDGYTYIRMSHIRPIEGSGARDVGTLRLSYRRADHAVSDPIIVVNYSYEGGEISSKQEHFLNKILPVLARRSAREIIFISATALRDNAEGKVQAVHLASLLTDLSSNNLGPGASHIMVQENGYILPYGYISVGGNKQMDFSWSVFRGGTPDRDIQKSIGGIMLDIVATSNQEVKSNP